MKKLLRVSVFAAALAVSVGAAAAAGSQPDRAAVVPCTTCHDQSGGSKSGGSIHAPVAGGKCLACHNAHASRHGSLLRRDTLSTCLSCHQDLAAKIRAGSPHAAVSGEKQCLSCHDPHSSERPKLLLNQTAALCLGCHEQVAKQSALSHPHPPAAKGECLKCHDPHVSERPALAARAEPELCVSCHKLPDARLAAAHKGVSIENAACSACHAPHGAAAAGMIRATAHPPFADGTCDACHTDPKEAPASLRPKVRELCETCHEERKAGHPVPKEAACLSCHTPHASSSTSLIAGRERQTCLACHGPIAAQRTAAAAYHPATGSAQDCTTCHQLHTGEGPSFLRKMDVQKMCMACHPGHSQFAHPMGEGVADPSHPGRSVNCLSCHDPHGTPFPQFLLADPRQELCLRCHRGDAH